MSRAMEAQIGAPATRGTDFGAHALPEPLERLRRVSGALGRGPIARRAVSLIRRLVCLGRTGPFDVEPFPGQRARLYPEDNLSEKRVFSAPQFWDAEERAALAAAALARPGERFVFVDGGANAGLYTLAVRSVAGDRLDALAVEPDAGNLARLRFNLAASGAGDEIRVAPVALSDRPGEVGLIADAANRGEIAVGAPGSGCKVPAQPLLDLILDAGFEQVDALKLDIEGMEAPVLRAFFETAPRSLWPGLVIVEARRGEVTEALALLHGLAYVEAKRTKLNVILTAPAPDDGPTGSAGERG